MERVAKSDRDLKKQGVWVQQQAKSREQRRQRANHMLEASLLFENRRKNSDIFFSIG